ncbi:TadE/TadG family type IV pilus assembly protein [Pseudoduganella namucuonensis]|uniref:TadE-like protein n=1 Tax=Pseudoduganella namucuonensis TaxID=1035707 RepID=A0A1I7IYA4_9BURK|nr:TadE/TadG family type IV pilus assembly protein [Pseudoduganella namucuonensis]SFU77907.1 TadE-like protein [Pseudoduganella namucuonensis]
MNLKRMHPQRGIAAIELALLLPVLIVLLAMPLYLGRVFWHYSVAQKAAHDAVRYLASVPLAQMRDPIRIAATVEATRSIVLEETADLQPGSIPVIVDVQCDGLSCMGVTTPTNVRVVVRLYMEDIFYAEISQRTDLLTADVTAVYVGI